MNTNSSLTETKDCKVPWCNRQSKANDERCEIHSEVHQAYVEKETEVQSSLPRCEATHICESCGVDLSYSSLPHCATCHRELWTFDKTYTPHSGFGNSTNLFD